MYPAAVLLLALSAAAADKNLPDNKTLPPARVVVTADLVCLHCEIGEGDSCAACLKLNEETPVLLEGKAAEQFFKLRFDKKVLVVEGILTRNKDKRLVLTSDNAHLFTDQDKDKAPPKGQLRATGKPVCGQCDLGLCDECTLALVNGAFPLILDGPLARQHADEGKESRMAVIVGRPYIDKRGLLRLEAKQVKLEKK